MKNDLQLQKEVMEELRWEPSINPAQIGVAVKNGNVVLSGWVNSYIEKINASKAAKRVAGVKSLVEDIQVGLSSAYNSSDAELLDTVRQVLKWHAGVEENNISATVEQGQVTLTGNVEWAYQRSAIVGVISKLIGVKAVDDQIQISTKVPSDDIHLQIASALERSAAVDTAQINLSVDTNKVLLKGKVPTLAQREAVEDIAWAAPGVIGVENRLAINK
jgi:osmotically-inducible protein OsmY